VMMLTCGGMLQWAPAKQSFLDFTSSRLITYMYSHAEYPIPPTNNA